MFNSLDEKSKALVRAAYINVIGMVLSSVGDPMILFLLMLYTMNVGMILILCYYTFGEKIEDMFWFFKHKIIRRAKCPTEVRKSN